MEKIRDRSGQVNSNSKLVSFLYILIRDHVTPGHIEEIMKHHIAKASEDGPYEALFSNGWLATYAMDIEKRLLNETDTIRG